MMQITVEIIVDKDRESVWKKWTYPDSIIKWNQASSDWHCPKAYNDLRVGGMFTSTMAAKDGSASFDFTGKYTKVEPTKIIEYIMPDGRKVSVNFESLDTTKTKIIEIFDGETIHSKERQQEGWQAILTSFKNYCEKS